MKDEALVAKLIVFLVGALVFSRDYLGSYLAGKSFEIEELSRVVLKDAEKVVLKVAEKDFYTAAWMVDNWVGL